MCRYAVIETEDTEATVSGKVGRVLALRNDLNDAFAYAEKHVVDNNRKVEIFERISTGKPATTVAWEGRRRPAIRERDNNGDNS